MTSRDEAIAVARAMAAARGCSCDPTITIDEPLPGIFAARVAHDDDCHLMLRRAAGRN